MRAGSTSAHVECKIKEYRLTREPASQNSVEGRDTDDNEVMSISTTRDALPRQWLAANQEGCSETWQESKNV